MAAATNRIDYLDEAAVRSGRFDINLEVNIPQDHTGHVKIWRAVLATTQQRLNRTAIFAEDVKPELMAEHTRAGGSPMSGSDIVNAIKQVSADKIAYEIEHEGHPAPPITREELGNALASIRDRSLDSKGRYEY